MRGFGRGRLLLLALAAIVTASPWLFGLLAYGFVARVLTGPTLSPLGQFVTRVVTPRLPVAPHWVPGPPKRFAQGIGATFTVLAALLTFALDQWDVARFLLGAMVVAASLEAFLGFCLGCKAFALLMKAGIIPEEVCERCNDIWGTSRI